MKTIENTNKCSKPLAGQLEHYSIQKNVDEMKGEQNTLVDTGELTGYPSIDKPWQKYYEPGAENYVIPANSVFDVLNEKAKDFKDEVALEYLSTKITYSKLMTEIERTAKALKAVGVEQNEIVSVCLPNIPEVVYLIYAINRIGAVANLLDVRSGEKALKTALMEAESKVLICLDITCERFQSILGDTSVEKVISVSAVEALPTIGRFVAKISRKELRPTVARSFMSWHSFMKMGKKYNGEIDVPFIPGKDAFIAYTGGTTGTPKGVIATNENIIAQFFMQSRHGHAVGQGDRSYVLAPPWTYYGLCNSLDNCLCSGITCALIPKYDNEMFGKDLCRIKPSYVVTVPAALNALMHDERLKKADLSFVKQIVVGADKLDEKLEIQFNEWLKNHNCSISVSKGYGMTEVMAAASVTKTGADAIGSVGIPCPGVIISAFHESNGKYEECHIGEEGEIAIQAPTIMKGYFGAADKETGDVIKQHEDGLLWAHTGDVGFVGEDGRIYIVGRIKRMFTRNGYKIFPATIEHCIMKHNSVAQAVVVSVADQQNGHITKAYVVKRQSSDMDDNRLREELSKLTAEELYEYEVPDIYELIDQVPLTAMGKVDFKALEKAM